MVVEDYQHSPDQGTYVWPLKTGFIPITFLHIFQLITLRDFAALNKKNADSRAEDPASRNAEAALQFLPGDITKGIQT